MTETLLALSLEREIAEELLAVDPGLSVRAPGVRGDPGLLVDGVVLGSSLAANAVTLLVAASQLKRFAATLARVLHGRGESTVTLKAASQPEVQSSADESELVAVLRALLAALEATHVPNEIVDPDSKELPPD